MPPDKVLNSPLTELMNILKTCRWKTEHFRRIRNVNIIISSEQNIALFSEGSNHKEFKKHNLFYRFNNYFIAYNLLLYKNEQSDTNHICIYHFIKSRQSNMIFIETLKTVGLMTKLRHYMANICNIFLTFYYFKYALKIMYQICKTNLSTDF